MQQPWQSLPELNEPSRRHHCHARLAPDWTVRERVNKWLGADWLKTNYGLVVRDLVAIDQLDKPLSSALDTFDGDDQILDLETEYDETSGQPSGQYPVIKDSDQAISGIQTFIEMSHIDKVPELILVDQRTETVVSHRDVSIGISQVLPVLVFCYGLRNKIIAIEQPEIHLHPALQAELGDVFIGSALGEQSNHFVLESLSEHLMLRILRRIRETAEKESAVDGIAVTPMMSPYFTLNRRRQAGKSSRYLLPKMVSFGVHGRKASSRSVSRSCSKDDPRICTGARTCRFMARPTARPLLHRAVRFWRRSSGFSLSQAMAKVGLGRVSSSGRCSWGY